MNGKVLALFDFDHTITKKDSFLDFLRYRFTMMELLQGAVFLFPSMILYKIGVIPNWRAKEIALQYFFAGWHVEKFRGSASDYSKKNLWKIIRPVALAKLKWHKQKGHRVMIVSASLRAWLQGWCSQHGVELISTEVETSKGKVTGFLKTPNCWGAEKLKRIREQVCLEDYDFIYAYGDSAGDTEMLSIADEAWYNWKKV